MVFLHKGEPELSVQERGQVAGIFNKYHPGAMRPEDIKNTYGSNGNRVRFILAYDGAELAGFLTVIAASREFFDSFIKNHRVLGIKRGAYPITSSREEYRQSAEFIIDSLFVDPAYRATSACIDLVSEAAVIIEAACDAYSKEIRLAAKTDSAVIQDLCINVFKMELVSYYQATSAYIIGLSRLQAVIKKLRHDF
ncbi:MAG: hypothetical protein PHP35_00530 [Candidatus Colwellbacteria bacterium]|nr:hypothetical protein [Candidatus Colwellbacteria bacterium]